MCLRSGVGWLWALGCCYARGAGALSGRNSKEFHCNFRR